MSRERELLERAYYVLGELSYAILKDSGEYNLAGDIYEFLSTPEPEQDEEPVAWMLNGEIYNVKQRSLFSDNPGEELPGQIPLYTHPAPRKPFVRLSEKEIERLMDSALAPREIDERDLHYFARAIEDALEAKNS